MNDNSDDFEIPEDWTPEDLVDYINVTLNKPNVKSVEIFLKDGKTFLKVHPK